MPRVGRGRIDGGLPGDFDRCYVESHLLGDRDILLTDDLALRISDGLRNATSMGFRSMSTRSVRMRRAAAERGSMAKPTLR